MKFFCKTNKKQLIINNRLVNFLVNQLGQPKPSNKDSTAAEKNDRSRRKPKVSGRSW